MLIIKMMMTTTTIESCILHDGQIDHEIYQKTIILLIVQEDW